MIDDSSDWAKCIVRRQQDKCRHAGATPAFDEEAARGLSSDEIRERWPRGHKCPNCGLQAEFYASHSHYSMGGW